jgi:hypothetical protein
MQYALLIYRAPGATPGEARPGDGVIDDWVDYTRATRDAGVVVGAEQLEVRPVKQGMAWQAALR